MKVNADVLNHHRLWSPICKPKFFGTFDFQLCVMCGFAYYV